MPTLKYRDPTTGQWLPVDGFIQPHPQASASATADLATTTGTVTTVPLDLVNYDTGGLTDGIWSLGSARLIAPMNGYYRISARVVWASNASGYRGWVVRKNGTNANTGGTLIFDQYVMAASGNVTVSMATSEPIYLIQGDYLTLNAVQSSGGSLNLTVANTRYSQMTMEYAGLVGPNGVAGANVTSVAASQDIQIAGKSIGRGQLAYAEITANTTINVVSTTHTDIPGLTVTLTPPAFRILKITAQTHGISTIANDRVQIGINDGATRLQSMNGPPQVTASGTYSIIGYAIVTSPTPVAHTYKLSLGRLLGTGTCNASAGATFPASILVEDIGGV